MLFSHINYTIPKVCYTIDDDDDKGVYCNKLAMFFVNNSCYKIYETFCMDCFLLLVPFEIKFQLLNIIEQLIIR